MDHGAGSDAWGIVDGYSDISGRWHETPAGTRDAIRRSMAPDRQTSGRHAGDRHTSDRHPSDGPPDSPPLWFLRAGNGLDGPPQEIKGPAELVLEDGTTIRAEERLPPKLPIGYHDLHPLDGGPTTRLVVRPRMCPPPPAGRTWGLSAQLYASRSATSWGIGDLADLRRIAAWGSGQGASHLAVSPLHAPGPAMPVDPSPYHPSSRRHHNPLHLRVEEVPGATGTPELEAAARAGRALNADRRIDRDRVWALKRPVLEATFAMSGRRTELDRFVAGRPGVATWATFCAIADRHGNDWRTWPAELRHPDTAAVARFAAAHDDRVRFHAWLQWAFDRQLAAAAGAGAGLVADLAVGFDPGGADAWELQDQLALDVRVGAPPDEFNTDGQDWGLPPFVPWRLRHARYEPFVDTVRASLRHAAGLRIDHVMGLFRLWWVAPDGSPAGGSRAGGAYVRYPASDLLDILAIESHRAGAFVVGEDLGTVEDSVRHELADRGVLSYRLLWFEDAPPEGWPALSLGALSTHDLPTAAGLWLGTDPGAAAMDAPRARLARAAGVTAGAVSPGTVHAGGAGQVPVGTVIVAAHDSLARGASAVVLASLDDLLAAQERPNLPGTVLPTNWTTALPETIETLEGSAIARAVVEAMREARPAVETGTSTLPRPLP